MSNLPSYITQIRLQRSNPNGKIAAVANELLSIINKKLIAKVGKDLDAISYEELKQIPFDINAKSREHRDFWGIDKLLSYEESSHFLGIFGKKHRDKRKKLIAGIGKGITNFTQSIAKVVTAPATLALLPFVPAMKKKISEKGITPKNKIRDLAEQFHKEIIKSYDYTDFGGSYVEVEREGNSAHALPLAAIIPAIIGFFKMLKEKAEQGKATAEELGLIKSIDEEQTKLDTQPEYKAQTIEKNSLEKTDKKGGYIMWIILAVIAFVIFRR